MRTLFLLVLLYPLLGSAQDYIPMLQEGNTWSVDTYFNVYDPPSPDPCCYTITEVLSIGDMEIINGQEYQRMLYGTNDACLLREENGILYKYDTFNSTEKVLIDMSLTEGDVFNLIDTGYNSISPQCSPFSGGLNHSELIVESVEHVLVAGLLRKVIVFDKWNSLFTTKITWIEGVGNVTGFDSFWEMIDITDGQLLVCFTTNGESYFFNDATSCDNTTLGLDDFSNEEVILYPNPVINISILQFPEDIGADTLLIYDISGKLVSEIKVDSNAHTINHMNYRSGLYFYKLVGTHEVLVSNKFIIK